MGWHYEYGGILSPDGEHRLWRDVVRARERLSEFKRALKAPVGSFLWEGAVHSGDTVEKLEENIREAEKRYEDYKKRKSH